MTSLFIMKSKIILIIMQLYGFQIFNKKITFLLFQNNTNFIMINFIIQNILF